MNKFISSLLKIFSLILMFQAIESLIEFFCTLLPMYDFLKSSTIYLLLTVPASYILISLFLFFGSEPLTKICSGGQTLKVDAVVYLTGALTLLCVNNDTIINIAQSIVVLYIFNSDYLTQLLPKFLIMTGVIFCSLTLSIMAFRSRVPLEGILVED